MRSSPVINDDTNNCLSDLDSMSLNYGSVSINDVLPLLPKALSPPLLLLPSSTSPSTTSKKQKKGKKQKEGNKKLEKKKKKK